MVSQLFVSTTVRAVFPRWRIIRLFTRDEFLVLCCFECTKDCTQYEKLMLANEKRIKKNSMFHFGLSVCYGKLNHVIRRNYTTQSK